MPILEICQLKIKHHLSQDDPSLLSALQKARTGLREKVVNTYSRFYRCIEDPSLIYILGSWPSLARHEQFLASPHKAEILDEQDEFFDFQWIIHTEIGGLEELPLDTPIVGIARLFVKNGGVEVYRSEVERLGKLIENTKPYKSVGEWRVDCEEGKFEHVIITGWQKDEDCAIFSKTATEYLKSSTIGEYTVCMDVKHARDMENEERDGEPYN